jgi:tetratricopeptide (TPR) repeat protein
MRKLVILAVTLLVLSGLGYFAYLNNDSVPLYVSKTTSLSIPVWALLLAFWVLGILISELRSLLTHPERPFQRFRRSLQEARRKKSDETYREFHQAVLGCDLRKVKRMFARITAPKASLEIRVQNLTSKRYQWDTSQMLQGFYQLRQEFPSELEVLLPYQEFALEAGEWSLAEQLSQEIDRLRQDHPQALLGMRTVAQQRNNWVDCVRIERKLLETYPKTVISDQVQPTHQEHLHRAAEQDPTLLDNWNLRYLPGGKKAVKHLYAVSAAITEARTLHESGQSIKGAELLRDCFEQNGTPKLLDEMEALYNETGNSQVILDMLTHLEKSSKSSLYVTLTLARIHQRAGNTEEAQALLQKISPESENAPSMYHALRYQLALKLKRPEEAIESAKQLTSADTPA